MVAITRYAIGVIITIVMIIFFPACVNINYDAIEAEGEVITKTREVGDFDKVKVSNGLRVMLKNGEPGTVEVQANENLHDIIITEVRDNTLYIKSDKNIRRADAKNIRVPVGKLDRIASSSGSSVRSNDKLNASKIELDSSSGSSIDINLSATTVDCESSSGSSLVVSGKANKIIADSSSGSTIDASDLKTNSCDAESSSGSTIRVNCDSSISARASSGSSIRYDGNPSDKNVKKSSGGSVRKL